MLLYKKFSVIIRCRSSVPSICAVFTCSSACKLSSRARPLYVKNTTKKLPTTSTTSVLVPGVSSTFLSASFCQKMSSDEKKNRSKLVAVCQITAKNNKEDNFNICKGLIKNAASLGAKVVFLPEACDFIGESKEEILELSEPLDGNIISKYKELAKALKVWLSLGGIHEKVDDLKVNNSHVVINDEGTVVSVYRKLHLFDVEIPERNLRLKESDFIKKGEEILEPVQSPVGEIGLAICYDLRFPEMSLILRNFGAKILTYPSAFTFATGSMHWEVLLRSRAIENQCYVIAAAQTGVHNKKRSSWGHAMVIDPLGDIVAQCSQGSNIAIANIDHELIENTRKSMPVKEHRRTDIYPKMLPVSKLTSSAPSSVATDNNSAYQFGQVSIPDSNVFYKTKLSMAFVNKRCIVPGHVLVAPLRVAHRLADLTSEEVSDLFLVAQKVESVMELVHGASSTTLAVQDGPEAGQTILHVHIHILPRKKGDFLQNDQVYYELQNHDKNEEKPWRCEQEMNDEANELRKYFY